MFSISFDFDENTHKVSNLKVVEKEQVIKELESYKDFDIQVLDSKIQLTSEAVTKLGVVPGDRISINYWYSGPNDAYPIISKAEVFTDGVDGLKLTKSKTLAFRGEQRDILLKYGTVFSFEEWRDKTGEVKDGVFKLIPVKEDDSSSEKNIVAFEEAAVNSMDQKELEDDADWLFEL